MQQWECTGGALLNWQSEAEVLGVEGMPQSNFGENVAECPPKLWFVILSGMI